MSSPVRVLYCSSFGDFRGGGQHSLDLLIRDMLQLGVTPEVAAPEEGDFLSSQRERGISTHVIPLPTLRGRKLGRAGYTIRQIRSLLHEMKVQLVHTDGPRSTILYGRAARSLGIPLVFHVRVSDKDPAWYERIVAAHADAMICVSRGAVDRFSWTRGGNVYHIPNGVDLELFHPGVEMEGEMEGFRRDPEDVLMGEIAFITPSKGQDVLISAMAALKPSALARLKVLFAGGGDPDYQQRLEMSIEKNDLKGNVEFLGPVGDIRPVLSTLDAILLPSVSEGLPRSLLEAAAMGLPLIASDIPGCREVVIDGENGYLCPSGDEGSWAGAIERMIFEADRTAMGRRSRTLVEEKFDTRKASRQILEVYRNLMAADPSSKR